VSAIRRLVPRPIRLAASGFLARRLSAGLRRDLAAMAARPAPIVAGPWLGEVGFELLYWVPFLRWCAEQMHVDPDRFVVMSRGGTSSWYQPFAARYADAFSSVSPETFRDQHDVRVRDLGEQKQTRVTEFDRQLIDGAMRSSRASDWSLLHPSRMYEVLNPYWWGHQSRDWVRAHTRYDRLTMPADAGIPDLPARYVAVKFYFNDCFPATPQNRAFVRDALQALTARGPVVALSTGLNIDDHGGVRVDELHGTSSRRSGAVRHLPEGMDPARNLHVQSAIVARAQAFVGTYGGFSYMAPFYGVKSVAFYSDPNGFSRKHLEMAHAALDAIGSNGLLDVRSTENGVGGHFLETLS
jgi:hypothetical protein